MIAPGRFLKALAGYVVMALAAVAVLVVMRRLTNGDFLNSYPFMSPDGFDWVFEGAYVHRLTVAGRDSIAPATVLRAPMFVFISWLDSIAYDRGIVIAVAIALAVLVSGSYVVRMLEEFGVRWWIRLWAALIFVLSPFSYFRAWVLADAIAIAFMHMNVYCLVKLQRTGDTRWLIAAAATMCLGGWTQTYAIIPFLVGIAIIGLGHRSSRVRVVKWATIVGASLAVYVAALVIWYRAIPHEGVPVQFGLLQLSLTMLPFYRNVWAFYFGPYAVILIYYLFSLRAGTPRIRADVSIVVASVVAFAFLLLFYQWREARFSGFYFGLVVILAALMLDRAAYQRMRAPAAIACLAIALVTTFVLVPETYWDPELDTLRVAPQSSWMAHYVRARPFDRFSLASSCGDARRFCEASALVSEYDVYATRVLGQYRRLMIDKATR